MCDIEFSDTLFQIVWHFHSFRQVQLKAYMLAENMLNLIGVKFHIATQP